ncbi:MAG: hypothetical protein L0H93_02920 [Nocardioides sp.]|nr:hypothetical protein [Nocardioides sp.]
MTRTSEHPVPAPLTVAVSLAGVEGAVMLGYAILELANSSADRLAMGVTTAVFFAMYGVGLAIAAWAVHRRHSWARSPIILAQLIQLGLAWNLRGGETTVVAAVLAVVAVIVIVGLLHPASIEHLADEEAAQ